MTYLALLPNLMGPDGMLIFLFILLFFGAKRLPELARGLGSAVREFSKAKDEIEHEITRAPTPRIEPPADTHAQNYMDAHVAEETPVTPTAPSTTAAATPVVATVPAAPVTEEHQHQTPA